MINYKIGYDMYILNPYIYGAAGVTYLLDTYSAAAAYSLRQLKTGVTNVVRVRRSSDNSESDFTADEITDGTLTTWTGANSGYVTLWYDQAGSNNITQSNASLQPRIVDAGTLTTRGGKPSVRFIGASNQRIENHSSAFLNLSDVSFFIVSSSQSTETVGVLSALNNSKTATIRILQDSRTATNRNLLVSNGTTTYTADLSTARVNTDQRLLSSFIDSSLNMSAFDNGATGGTNTYVTGTEAATGLTLGVQYTAVSTPSTPLDGHIQEFIAFNTDQSANRTDIESDINTYYSIY